MGIGKTVADLENELDKANGIARTLKGAVDILRAENSNLKKTNHGLLEKHAGYREAVKDLMPYMKGALEVYRE